MDGEYRVYANCANSRNASLTIPSNTNIELNGQIEYLTSSLDNYVVFWIDNVSNVSIKGKGRLIGDKEFHLGDTGEWGYGIGLNKSCNVSIEGIECFNFWGDAIYLSHRAPVCDGVQIRDVYLHDCRRQGISITGGKNIIVENFKIENIYGTNPQSAIDVENHSPVPIVNVFINRGDILNCKQGIILQNKPPQDVISSPGYEVEGRLSNISVTNINSNATCLLTHNVLFDDSDSSISIVGPCIIRNSSVSIEEIANWERLEGICTVDNCHINKLSNQASSHNLSVSFDRCKFVFGESASGNYYRNVNNSLLIFNNCHVCFSAPIQGYYYITNAIFRSCVIDCYDTPFLRSTINDSDIIIRLKGDDKTIFTNRGKTEIYNSRIRIVSQKKIPLYSLEGGDGRYDLIIHNSTISDVIGNRTRVVDMSSGKSKVNDDGTSYYVIE